MDCPEQLPSSAAITQGNSGNQQVAGSRVRATIGQWGKEGNGAFTGLVAQDLHPRITMKKGIKQRIYYNLGRIEFTLIFTVWLSV